MKKVILSLAIVAIGALSASAQSEKAETKDFKVGVGVTAGIPVGDYKSISNFAYGADIQAAYNVASTLDLTLSGGFVKLSGKNGVKISGALIPVLAGAKFHFTDKLYGHAQLGVSFSTESGGGSAFTYVPSIGYDVSSNFDLSVKYQASTKNSVTLAFIGLRAAYTF